MYCSLFVIFSFFIFSRPHLNFVNSEIIPNSIVLIQGIPCPDLDSFYLKSEATNFPRECDHLCSRTTNCESFTWNRKDSTCNLFAMHLNQTCFIRDDNQFWFVKHFTTSRASFSDYVTLTKNNQYSEPNPAAIANTPSSFQDCRAYDAMTWISAKQTCAQSGLKLFTPESLDQIAMIQNCAGIPDGNMWTGYKKSETVDPISGQGYVTGFSSDDLMIFFDDQMFGSSSSSLFADHDSYSCVRYNEDLGVLKNVGCNELLRFVCVADSIPRTCENNDASVVYEELLRVDDNPVAMRRFLSAGVCSEVNALDSYESTLTDADFAEVQRVAQLVKPGGNYETQIAFKYGTGLAETGIVQSVGTKLAQNHLGFRMHFLSKLD